MKFNQEADAAGIFKCDAEGNIYFDEKTFYRYIGDRIKAIRVMRKMSQEEVARALGVTFQQVQKYESGANRIPIANIVRLAMITGLDLAELLGECCPVWRAGATDSRDLRLISLLKSLPENAKEILRGTIAGLAEYLDPRA
jgi:transcriptional regulator with XRE-family HTH domain